MAELSKQKFLQKLQEMHEKIPESLEESLFSGFWEARLEESRLRSRSHFPSVSVRALAERELGEDWQIGKRSVQLLSYATELFLQQLASKSLICQMHDVEADEEVNLPTNIPANIPTNIPTHTPTSSPPNPRSNNVVSSAERPEAIFSKDLPTKNENEHPEQPLITRSQSQEQISTSIPTTTATTNISAPTPTSSGNTDTEKSTETNSEVSNNDEAQVAQVPTTQISAPHPPGTIQPVHVALAIARTDLFDFLLPFIKSYYDEPNNEPRFDFGCWRVEKKLTDPEQVDILFPKDEDYFEWRGPARGKFEFRIQKVDDRLPVSGEFVLGGSHGAISGTMNPVDRSIHFHFTLLHQSRGRAAGTGKATLAGYELSIQLDYELPTGFELPWTEQELSQVPQSELLAYLYQHSPALLPSEPQAASLAELLDLLLVHAKNSATQRLSYLYVCLAEVGKD